MLAERRENSRYGENQELGAELVSAVTRGLFTVTGKPDLGGYSIACLLLS